MSDSSEATTLLSLSELLGRRVPSPQKRVGVYFLFRDDRLIYIGQSLDVDARVRAHASPTGYDFDSYAVIETREEDLHVELDYIGEFLPPYNRCHLSRSLRTSEQEEESDRMCKAHRLKIWDHRNAVRNRKE